VQRLRRKRIVHAGDGKAHRFADARSDAGADSDAQPHADAYAHAEPHPHAAARRD
jgi:hypothetical protein